MSKKILPSGKAEEYSYVRLDRFSLPWDENKNRSQFENNPLLKEEVSYSLRPIDRFFACFKKTEDEERFSLACRELLLEIKEPVELALLGEMLKDYESLRKGSRKRKEIVSIYEKDFDKNKATILTEKVCWKIIKRINELKKLSRESLEKQKLAQGRKEVEQDHPEEQPITRLEPFFQEVYEITNQRKNEIQEEGEIFIFPVEDPTEHNPNKAIKVKINKNYLNKLKILTEEKAKISPDKLDAVYDFAHYLCEDREIQKDCYKHVIRFSDDTTDGRMLSARALVNLGNIAFHENDIDSAIELCNKAHEFYPKSHHAYHNKACFFSIKSENSLKEGNKENSDIFLKQSFEILKEFVEEVLSRETNTKVVVATIERISEDKHLHMLLSSNEHHKNLISTLATLVTKNNSYYDRTERALEKIRNLNPELKKLNIKNLSLVLLPFFLSAFMSFSCWKSSPIDYTKKKIDNVLPQIAINSGGDSGSQVA